ncbi:hypothetical protein ACHQM5_009265 [Ranunculus cassubicifolius]
MEETTGKTLERVVSQKALQMGSSFPCQICVVGFFCGVCLTYFFLAALTTIGAIQLGGLAFSSMSQKSSGIESKIGDASPLLIETERINSQKDYERVLLLYSAWNIALNQSADKERKLLSTLKLSRSNIPDAPHLENCKLSTQINGFLDNLRENGTFSPESTTDQHLTNVDGPHPPWIVGSDEDNFPLTRKVQRDLWMHQHPKNCCDPGTRFLVADWEKLPGFGIGAQLAGMCGLLAIAIKEQRVLVTNYFNRADHDGCKGSSRSRWSCYFFSESSLECQDRAFELMKKREAWEDGSVTGKDNYTSKEIWAGRIPRVWGEPWSFLQPTTEVNGSLIRNHRKMDRRWWRAQAVRYLMRFRSEYTCELMNTARHNAFGLQAAEMVLQSVPQEWPKVVINKPQTDMERIVWSNHKPWIPRPILSIHVRMGDKACEMKVIEFEEYMRLADRIRTRFPNLNSIWLSTEMQEVIDKSRSYPHWNFYYTNVTRQVGNITMASYESSLGRETSTNYPLVNFLMASEADFFIGALGSTWCFLIDGMRNTGGKVMAGYLSVNKDRFW